MSMQDTTSLSGHPGFTRSIDPIGARRQLHMSLGIVALLAAGIGGSAYAIKPVEGFDVMSQRAQISSLNATAQHNVNAAVRLRNLDRS